MPTIIKQNARKLLDSGSIQTERCNQNYVGLAEKEHIVLYIGKHIIRIEASEARKLSNKIKILLNSETQHKSCKDADIKMPLKNEPALNYEVVRTEKGLYDLILIKDDWSHTEIRKNFYTEEAAWSYLDKILD